MGGALGAALSLREPMRYLVDSGPRDKQGERGLASIAALEPPLPATDDFFLSSMSPRLVFFPHTKLPQEAARRQHARSNPG